MDYSFPESILVEIFQYLQPEEVCQNAALVATAWAEAARSQMLWKKFCLQLEPTAVVEDGDDWRDLFIQRTHRGLFFRIMMYVVQNRFYFRRQFPSFFDYFDENGSQWSAEISDGKLCREIVKSASPSFIVTHGILPCLIPNPSRANKVCCAIELCESAFADNFMGSLFNHRGVCDEDVDFVFVPVRSLPTRGNGWVRHASFLSVSQNEMRVGDVVVLRLDHTARRTYIINRTQKRLLATRALPAAAASEGETAASGEQLVCAVSVRGVGTRLRLVPAVGADYRDFAPDEIAAARSDTHWKPTA